MSFLNHNLKDVPELSVKEPAEYELRIVEAEIKLNENANSQWFNDNMLIVRFEIADDPNAKDITQVFRIPQADEDDQKRMNNDLRRIKVFMEAFGLDPNCDAEDMAGETGWALLDIEESDEYGEQNRIKRFVVGG